MVLTPWFPTAPADGLGHPHLESQETEGEARVLRPGLLVSPAVLVPRPVPSAEGWAGQGKRTKDLGVCIMRSRWDGLGSVDFQNGEGLRQDPAAQRRMGHPIGWYVPLPAGEPQGAAGRGSGLRCAQALAASHFPPSRSRGSCPTCGLGST